MEYIVLDLEWNGTYSRKKKQFFNEIIEFGAVKLNEERKVIDYFTELVRPAVGKKLSRRVKKLTHIEQDEVLSGVPFSRALHLFKRFLGNGVLLTWGISDLLVLIENHQYYFGTKRLAFLNGYLDLQRYCQFILLCDQKHQMGLYKAAKLFGIDQNTEERHRALYDSMIAADCFVSAFNLSSFFMLLQDTSSEIFFEKLFFQKTPIYDLSDPRIDWEEMFFDCEHCQEKAKRISDWKVKQKSFTALFRCSTCGEEFMGRIRLIQTYDSILVKKKRYQSREES